MALFLRICLLLVLGVAGISCQIVNISQKCNMIGPLTNYYHKDSDLSGMIELNGSRFVKPWCFWHFQTGENIMLTFYLRDLKLPSNSSLVIASQTSSKYVVYNSLSNGISEPVESLFTNKFYVKFYNNNTHKYYSPKFKLHFGPYFGDTCSHATTFQYSSGRINKGYGSNFPYCGWTIKVQPSYGITVKFNKTSMIGFPSNTFVKFGVTIPIDLKKYVNYFGSGDSMPYNLSTISNVVWIAITKSNGMPPLRNTTLAFSWFSKPKTNMTSYPSYMDHHANFDHPTTVANWGTVMSTTTPKNNNHSTTYFSWTVSFGLCFASFFLVITVVSWYIRQRRLQALQQSSISSRRFSRDPVSMSRPPSTVNEVTVPPSYEDCVQARGGASKDQITGDEALPDIQTNYGSLRPHEWRFTGFIYNSIRQSQSFSYRYILCQYEFVYSDQETGYGHLSKEEQSTSMYGKLLQIEMSVLGHNYPYVAGSSYNSIDAAY
ncbi:uncharacterized protein TRIADDRAFT_60884 [Trichoplax adhaerens]|uniref:CUB domain-containing protein n=1 Tax=Trichoplax adhaerens TaxID=10228 RepID=B3S9F2_TRIAD|nr:predicted protein [Trichoplax adhaerens]EDV20640.1 predicted protein [Trichoplax adhaerens]|eukprot:XP_002116840.1 predicted protein [Trichoplax adhaerens]